MTKLKKYKSIREAVELIAKDELSPKALTREDRRLCVEFLRYEMRYSSSKIAKLLQCTPETVAHDLKIINIGTAKLLEHGEVTAEIVGQVLKQLGTNYDMALQKNDVASANKATELLVKFAQDLGHVSKSDDVVSHKGLDILSLAKGASEKPN